ncbi:MAG: hypothetical protein U0636_03470 [Phycisphaerales bacterium]
MTTTPARLRHPTGNTYINEYPAVQPYYYDNCYGGWAGAAAGATAGLAAGATGGLGWHHWNNW